VRIEARWKHPGIFDLLMRGGGIETGEMRRTFNVGVGFIFVVAGADEAKAMSAMKALGEEPIALGRVVTVPADREFEARVEWHA
jgi:phosphoribosylformylglycinamidine cyclo-ligase